MIQSFENVIQAEQYPTRAVALQTLAVYWNVEEFNVNV